ncbi:MAG: phosphatidylserine decarboxylase [Bacteroidetes bacterium]|nr:MAG: phosphatidylserine decarboxylase [Bacteroidota bacterium]
MKVKKRYIVISLFVIVIGLAIFPSPENLPIRYVERSSGELKTEKVAGEKWLVWLYNNPVGEFSLYAMVKRKFVSSIYGGMMDSENSADKIAPFVEEYNIDLSIAEKNKFTSFNDFFTRKLKKGARPIDQRPYVIVSPGDGKIMAYADASKADFIVKGSRFNVQGFLADSILAQKYINGSIVVLRLCPTDYHRYHFPVSGRVSFPVVIDGDYYSVNPIALREKLDVFLENKREYVLVSTQLFGDVVMAEVGATMVGGIIQTYEGEQVEKGVEKGYFKFGGSTVVLLFEKGKALLDKDLLENTQNNLETEVKMGERIAISPGPVTRN